MKIVVARGTLTKDEQYKLAELLVRVGYEVSVRKGDTKETKSATFIHFQDCKPDIEEEDLS